MSFAAAPFGACRPAKPSPAFARPLPFSDDGEANYFRGPVSSRRGFCICLVGEPVPVTIHFQDTDAVGKPVQGTCSTPTGTRAPSSR